MATTGAKRQYMAAGPGGEQDQHGSRVAGAGEDWALADGRAAVGSREHIEDPVTSLVMGLPLDLQFRTKGQLAIDICADCYAHGLEFDFACGDEVCGGRTQLQEFFEQRGQLSL